ncbi:iron ABC transporter permease [Lishizhenia sp.]|uniref:ABC transporter permease n=1 Tax=Lishizhenia sp. TaxID=2497594 RepID=UPI00299EED6F|nr:iron ABC transporter permease [Lishizhenia sp.]MDX1445089.1 iron ABC transporter permease [Lishizhenia sp.]
MGGIIFIPLLFVLEGFADGTNENIQHIQEYVLPDLIYTTLRMILGVSAVSILLAVPTAYFVANFNFPLRRFLEKANVLPLTIPTYIMGFVYASIFSFTGSFTKLSMLFFTPKEIFAWDVNVLTEGWLMVFLGFALYPYVYSSSLLHFSSKNKAITEAASTLGVSSMKRFFTLILPLAIPSILGGTVLVIMEVINDYGAVSYFNVKTFSAGIFQAKQMDFSGSLYLSALAFVFISVIFGSLFVYRNMKRVSDKKNSSDFQLKQLKGPKAMLFSFLAFLPFFLGFVVPVAQLIYLSFFTPKSLVDEELFSTTLESFRVAIIPALVIVIITLLLLYNKYLNKGWKSSLIANLSTLGYAIPGAVIGVAVLGFAFFMQEDGDFYAWGIESLFLLSMAYVIRFMAVGYNTLEANYARLPDALPDASRVLGKSSFATFLRVNFPILKFGIFTTFAVVIIDVLKDLPLTLILQPFNFETLATKAYKKAKVAESVTDAAPYALLLIALGVVVSLVLMRSNKSTK